MGGPKLPQNPAPDVENQSASRTLAQNPVIGKEQQGDGGKKTETVAEKSLKNAIEKLRIQQKKDIAEIEKIFSDHISPAHLPEIAIGAAKRLREKQIVEYNNMIAGYEKILRAKYQQIETNAKKERYELSNGIKDHTRIPRETYRTIADEIEIVFKEAQREAHNRREILKFMLNAQTDTMTPEQIVSLSDSLETFNQFLSGKDKNGTMSFEQMETVNLMKKISAKETLTDKDYEKIASLIEPYEPKSKLLDLEGKEIPVYDKEKMLEATTSGLILSMLRPDQRYKLIEEYVLRKENSPKIIDGLISAGLLTPLQGSALLTRGREIYPSRAADFNPFIAKCESREYEKAQEQTKKNVQEQADKLKGKYAINPMIRGFGGPFIAGAMTIHSAIWMFSNILANEGDIAALLRNPYMYAGVAEYILAKEIGSSGMKYGGDMIGNGSVAAWIRENFDKDIFNDDVKRDEIKKSIRGVGEIYASSPNFALYLESGGAGAIVDLQEQKKKNKKGEDRKKMTANDLLEYEKKLFDDGGKDHGRYKLLQQELQNFSKESVTKRINGLTTLSKNLKINIGLKNIQISAQKSFEKIFTAIRHDQGLPQLKSKISSIKPPNKL